jgi:Tol biopolymer transport system component
MGEVYRAHDSRLDRDVAIKILPAAFARDGDRMRRFEAEARAVAALNHPNILAVHDVGSFESMSYLVCELLEGETLRDRLKEGAIPSRKAIEYAQQIAQALAAAHEKGIIHRDLKPENIFISKDGRIKILDFGLAKLERLEFASAQSATMTTVGGTSPGTVMGTAGYMSPEQVRGAAVDSRSDIFSFGAVLYEMLTGSRAFQGESSVETMNAVLKSEPREIDVEKLNVSPALDRIIRHCLEKNPAERFQSARDLSFALVSISGTTATTRALAAAKKPANRTLYAVTAALVVLVLAGAVFWLIPRKQPASPMYFGMSFPDQVTNFALSRDGRMLAFVTTDEATGKNMLYVQAVGGRSAQQLPGTEGARFPFWSPDGQYVAFFNASKLMKIRLGGSAPETIANVSPSPRGGSWGSKNVIVFEAAATSGLLGVNADGSELKEITNLTTSGSNPESSHRWPQLLPDGDHFLFLAWSLDPQIYLGSISTGKTQPLVHSRAGAEYIEPGYLLYLDDKRDLVMQRLDISAGKLYGDVRSLGLHPAYDGVIWKAAFSASQDGRTILANPNRDFALSRLTFVDRTGKPVGTLGDLAMMYNPAISADGSRVAFDLNDLQTANTDIFIADAHGATAPRRLTFGPEEEVNPLLSPDGKYIAFRRYTKDGNRLVLKALSGSVPDRIIANPFPDANDVAPESWSKDGRWLVCDLRSHGNFNLVLVDVAAGTRRDLLVTPANEENAQISPDGKWMAYTSDESGQDEVYVTSFPDATGKWQISKGGGSGPRWRGDGKEIFYADVKGMLTAAGIKETPDGISVSGYTPLFPLMARNPISGTDLISYDVTRDGQRFLVNRYVKPDHVEPFEVLLNGAGGEK